MRPASSIQRSCVTGSLQPGQAGAPREHDGHTHTCRLLRCGACLLHTCCPSWLPCPAARPHPPARQQRVHAARHAHVQAPARAAQHLDQRGEGGLAAPLGARLGAATGDGGEKQGAQLSESPLLAAALGACSLTARGARTATCLPARLPAHPAAQQPRPPVVGSARGLVAQRDLRQPPDEPVELRIAHQRLEAAPVRGAHLRRGGRTTGAEAAHAASGRQAGAQAGAGAPAGAARMAAQLPARPRPGSPQGQLTRTTPRCAMDLHASTSLVDPISSITTTASGMCGCRGRGGGGRG